MDEITASLALRHTPGLGPRTAKRLLATYQTAVAAAEAWRDWAPRGLASPRVAAAFGRWVWRAAVDEELAALARLRPLLLPWSHPQYPSALRQIPDPPILLYGRGCLDLVQGPCVAVVGSRRPSRYGQEMAALIARDLAQAGICVVSGLAVGIDAAAHRAALDEVGSSCAVLGTGVDLIYPAVHQELWRRLAQDGLVLTEFAPQVAPQARNFPYRNRIISGMSLGVVVVEAAHKSGSLVTASLAAAQGREVFVVPGPANAETFQGSHQLVRDGATLIQSAQDVLQELASALREYSPAGQLQPSGPSSQPVPPEKSRAQDPEVSLPQTFPSEEGRILWQALQDASQPRHVDALAQDLGWDAGRVSAALLLLEMEGLVRQYPGMYYTVSTR